MPVASRSPKLPVFVVTDDDDDDDDSFAWVLVLTPSIIYDIVK